MSAQRDGRLARASEIVVGVDGSPQSVAALAYAADLAEALSGRLAAIATWQSLQTLHNDAEHRLHEAAATVFPDGTPSWFQARVLEGPAAARLIAASTDAAMLVVGSRGIGGFEGLVQGSVSAAVAEHAACPVLVFHDGPAKRPRTV